MKNLIGVLEGMQSSAITVRQERCAMVRNRNAACLRCADACTSGCISLTEGRLSVDLAKCVGCGTCATVCPTCALEAHNPSDAQLLRDALEAREADVARIACHPLAAAWNAAGGEVPPHAEVVCLGRVDESLAVGLAERGVRRVELACADCDACAQRQGRACAEMVRDSANALLEAWGSATRVHVVQAPAAGTLEANEPIVPVRAADADGAAAPDAPAPDAPLVPKVMRDGTLAHFVPDRRERLLDALVGLGQPETSSLSTRLWGMVVIDGRKCSSCRMCSTFCPTGALARFDEADGTFGVEHFPGDCVKCGTCEAICPEGAIVIRDEVPAEYVLGGAVHTYRMRPRDVEFGAHQIYQTVSRFIDGDSFER